MADPAEIMSALELLTAAYPDKTLPKATLQVYMSALRNIPIDVLHRAVQQSILTSPWFPKVSDLYGLSLKIAGVRRFEPVTGAIIDGLYGEFDRAVRLGGPRRAAGRACLAHLGRQM